ncbi:MAG: methionine adenosyltransferase, partial [Clostridia bacterium]|nr:methionine adenosyltransferase [Clostridia bacterium]
MYKLFTSESVTEGHPDKVCDIISDAVLDEILRNDENARVACECFATTGCVFISGEITTDCYVDIQKIARDAIDEIGYNRAKFGFDAENCAVLTAIKEQSPDIALGVDNSLEFKLSGEDRDRLGAGDQ